MTVAGNGAYDSPEFTPTAVGTYRFTATCSGDANNDPAASACDDPKAVVTVEPPRITALGLSPRRFATQGTPTAPGPPPPRAVPRGSTIELTLTAASLVHFSVRHDPPRDGHGTGRCRGFNRQLAAGANEVAFSGRLRYCGRRLKPGRYVLNARPVSASGERFERLSAQFTIVGIGGG